MAVKAAAVQAKGMAACRKMRAAYANVKAVKVIESDKPVVVQLAQQSVVEAEPAAEF
jgi:hypothetical protein